MIPRLYQFYYGEAPEHVLESLDHNRKLFGDNYFLEVFPAIPGLTAFQYTILSDRRRLALAVSWPNMLYADWDVRFREIPPFEDNGRPYFPLLWPEQNRKQFDGFVFYVNGGVDFFVWLENNRIERGIDNRNYGFPFKMLRDIEKRVNVFPLESLEHSRASGFMPRGETCRLEHDNLV